MNTDTAQALQRLLHADVASLQQEDGSFAGDQWGEIDTRQVQLCMCLSWFASIVSHQYTHTLPTHSSPSHALLDIGNLLAPWQTSSIQEQPSSPMPAPDMRCVWVQHIQALFGMLSHHHHARTSNSAGNLLHLSFGRA